jgi:hypothetical protein
LGTPSDSPQMFYEGFGAADALLSGYDPSTGAWTFPRTGPFWSAVERAHAAGYRGAGRRIAIIDSAFDMSVPALARAGALRMANRDGASTSHGTAVALLALAAAPDASLDLYPVGVRNGPDPQAIVAALRAIAKSGCVSVCLSLGAPTLRSGVTISLFEEAKDLVDLMRRAEEAYGAVDARPRKCPLPQACLCTAVDALPSSCRVFAAVGNHAERALCPAMAKSAIAIGFKHEHRERAFGDGEVAQAVDPGFAQQTDLADYLLTQPVGVLGSSFATPLMAGAEALALDAKSHARMIDCCRLGGHADALQAQIMTEADLESLVGGAMLRSYVKALTEFPHINELRAGDHWCIGCGLYGEALFTNAGRAFLIWNKLLPFAEATLRIARGLAPLSPHAAANLGQCLLNQAELVGQGKERRDLAREAAACYDEALSLRPGYRGYDESHATAHRLADLPNGNLARFFGSIRSAAASIFHRSQD